jgi:hypothetical protein
MRKMMSIIAIILVVVLVLCIVNFPFRNARGFDRKGIHRNGTKFDDFGYDAKGYDKSGYDRNGFDKQGYNKAGFNGYGYKIDGRNANGKYNRLYDIKSYMQSEYNKEGFLNPQFYPVGVTNHARERICERYPDGENVNADNLARDVYAYGKSSYQVMKTSAVVLREIESRYDNGIALVYKGYIFIFSEENDLITMYKAEKVIV